MLLSIIIIQHTLTPPKYGHGALNIRRPYSTDDAAVYVVSCIGVKTGKIM